MGGIPTNYFGEVLAKDADGSDKIVDGLITNFHQPESTLLMLTSSFGGYKFIKEAYKVAKQKKYRFLSYGDSMLIT